MTKFLTFFALAFLSSISSAAGIAGVVERVSDGDTIRVTGADGVRTVVRLAGIDAPEKDQPFGRAAGRRLAALCLGKVMEADFRSFDRYGRTVARVRCEGVDVARTLLDEGLAWHFKRYSRTQPPEESLDDSKSESLAREAKAGLWSESEPVAPWDWRAAKKMRQGQKSIQP